MNVILKLYSQTHKKPNPIIFRVLYSTLNSPHLCTYIMQFLNDCLSSPSQKPSAIKYMW